MVRHAGILRLPTRRRKMVFSDGERLMTDGGAVGHNNHGDDNTTFNGLSMAGRLRAYCGKWRRAERTVTGLYWPSSGCGASRADVTSGQITSGSALPFS
jgi:hypothetical protein